MPNNCDNHYNKPMPQAQAHAVGSQGDGDIGGGDIPPLTIGPVPPTDILAALRLVPDSIAQQRQVAAREAVQNPATLGVLATALGVVYKLIAPLSGSASFASDSIMAPMAAIATSFLLPATAVIMTALLLIRWMTSPYITHAETVAASMATPYLSGKDVVLGAKFGQEYAATLVLRLLGPDEDKRELGGSCGVGVIRAWTTRLRYRHRGLGEDMLRAAIRTTREELGGEADVKFYGEHANSLQALPAPWLFGRGFERREEMARRMLQRILDDERRNSNM